MWARGESLAARRRLHNELYDELNRTQPSLGARLAIIAPQTPNEQQFRHDGLAPRPCTPLLSREGLWPLGVAPDASRNPQHVDRRLDRRRPRHLNRHEHLGVTPAARIPLRVVRVLLFF